jgi:hypothetical protein
MIIMRSVMSTIDDARALAPANRGALAAVLQMGEVFMLAPPRARFEPVARPLTIRDLMYSIRE